MLLFYDTVLNMDPNRYNYNNMLPTSSNIIFNPVAAFQSMFQNMPSIGNSFNPSIGQPSSNPFQVALEQNNGFSHGYSVGQNQNWTSTTSASTVGMPMMVCMMFPMTVNMNNYPQQMESYSNQQGLLPASAGFEATFMNGAVDSSRTVEIVDEGPNDLNSSYNRPSDRDRDVVTYDSVDDVHYGSYQHGGYEAQVSRRVHEDPADYNSSANQDDDIEVIPRDRAMFEFNRSNPTYSNLRRISPSRSPVRSSSTATSFSDRRRDQEGLKSILKRRYGDCERGRSSNQVRFNISDDDEPEVEKFTLDSKTKRKGKRRRDPVRKVPVKSAAATTSQGSRELLSTEDDGYINEDESDLDTLDTALAARKAAAVPFRVPEVPRTVTVITFEDDGSERQVTPLWSPSVASSSGAASTDGRKLIPAYKDVAELDDGSFEDNWVARYFNSDLAESTENDEAAVSPPSTSAFPPSPAGPEVKPKLRFNPFENPLLPVPEGPSGLKTPRCPPPPPIIRPSPTTSPQPTASSVSDDVNDEDIVIVDVGADDDDITLPVISGNIEPDRDVFKRPQLTPRIRSPLSRPQPQIPQLMNVVIKDPKVDAVAANTQKIRDSMNLICKNIGKDPFKIIREVCTTMQWKEPIFFTRSFKLETIRGPETRYKVSAAIGGQLLTPTKLEVNIEKAQYRSAVFSVNTLRNNFTKYMTKLGLIVPKFNMSNLLKRNQSHDGNREPGGFKMPRSSADGPFQDNRTRINVRMPDRPKMPRFSTTKPNKPFNQNEYRKRRPPPPRRLRQPGVSRGHGRPSDRMNRNGGSFKGRNW